MEELSDFPLLEEVNFAMCLSGKECCQVIFYELHCEKRGDNTLNRAAWPVLGWEWKLQL